MNSLTLPDNHNVDNNNDNDNSHNNHNNGNYNDDSNNGGNDNTTNNTQLEKCKQDNGGERELPPRRSKR